MPKFRVTVAQNITRYWTKDFKAENEQEAHALAENDAETGLNNWAEHVGDSSISGEHITDVRKLD